jgi:hypothetical protein
MSRSFSIFIIALALLFGGTFEFMKRAKPWFSGTSSTRGSLQLFGGSASEQTESTENIPQILEAKKADSDSSVRSLHQMEPISPETTLGQESRRETDLSKADLGVAPAIDDINSLMAKTNSIAAAQDKAMGNTPSDGKKSGDEKTKDKKTLKKEEKEKAALAEKTKTEEEAKQKKADEEKLAYEATEKQNKEKAIEAEKEAQAAAAQQPIASAPNQYPFGGAPVSKSTSSVQEWVTKITAAADISSISQFIQEHRSNSVNDDIFYSVLAELSKQSRADIQSLAIYGYNSSPSTKSFRGLIAMTQQSDAQPATRLMAQNHLQTYAVFPLARFVISAISPRSDLETNTAAMKLLRQAFTAALKGKSNLPGTLSQRPPPGFEQVVNAAKSSLNMLFASSSDGSIKADAKQTIDSINAAWNQTTTSGSSPTTGTTASL